MTAIRDEAVRRRWPKLYFAPIDEPGNSKTENRMQFAENVLDLVHEVPGCQTAVTVGAAEVQRLGDRVDVRIYAYGSYSRGKALRDARQGHPFWYYDNGMFYGHSTVASRGMAGFEFLRSGASVASAWGFDCTYGNPENDFDSGHRDWNVVFPGVDRLAPTIYWEMCREGVDDCRYVATLQEEIRRARARGERTAARRAERVLAPLTDPDARPIEDPLAFGRYRWRIARETMALRGDRRHALTFAAVIRGAAPKERLSRNVVSDPSFEAGPQVDGFPTAAYSVSDQYAKQDLRPVGALRVTDEAAHSGRYSLKWDFARADGKGSVYGRDRWLIVNVQVPQKSAESLRGKRVRVGYWFRLGGGAVTPGMVLRQFGRGEFLGGISYAGGVDDPAVWNHFVAEDRLRTDYEGLDIHIACIIPSDPEQARKAVFYLDDVSLQAVEEPPLSVAAGLEEVYVGETMPWRVAASVPGGEVNVDLVCGGQRVASQRHPMAAGAATGGFSTRGLRAGLYELRAALRSPAGPVRGVVQQVIVAPDPFDWGGGRRPAPRGRTPGQPASWGGRTAR